MRANEFVQENFDDGKKPGRKGLAKRVGVNCKQSVSKLRKIAANSSGERQRMAHWCANMKSGKQKTNEYVNKKMLDPSWHAETTVDTDIGPVDLDAVYHGAVTDQIIITARQNKKYLGQVRFVISTVDRSEPVLVAGNLSVDPAYRRRGIASAMYRWAKELGNSIEPSYTQTDAGRAFWQGMSQQQIDEDWRNWVSGLGAASMIAGGGSAAYDAYKSKQQPQTTQAAQVQQVQTPQAKVTAPVAQKPQISQAQAVGHAQDLLATRGAQVLQRAAKAAGLKGNELAQFMAQCAHETANFTTLKELGDRKYFRKYDIKFNPSKAKELGNVRPGDGELYKGRGFIQLTGRYNYKKAGEALGLPLEKNPRLVERPDVAAKVALWFWKNRVQPQVANFQDTTQATKPINPGLRGLQDRHNKFTGMKVAMDSPSTAKPAVKPATNKPVQATKVASKPTKVKKV